ncbi:GntR family transcriptional regulator [Streptomyces chumphonensis]|uniref:GntR family transcriptional regulator n=1 Tax=Streptomyces chumphonensis TaxID=1214925 RepID=A0A927F2B4_9ACTN|nr:GntR family transcriptional regulator [Streptomyces chumphonensis]MBD3933021.1 GntR family transcriptional regulator [Streptomyces chumphonensis]
MPLTPPAGGDADPRAPHVRAAAALRDAILCGTWPPGSALPTTSELARLHGVRESVAAQAISLLIEEGLVTTSGPHAAVTVRPCRQQTVRPADSGQPVGPGESYRWLSVAERQGKRGTITLLDVAEVRPPAEVADALELGETGTAVLRRQLLQHDGEPVELAECYYPMEIARGTALVEARRIRGGTPTLLAGLGLSPHRTVDRVSARVPTQAQYEALRLPGDLPILRTFRVVYSKSDGRHRPIETTVMAKAGHLYEVRYEF